MQQGEVFGPYKKWASCMSRLGSSVLRTDPFGLGTMLFLWVCLSGCANSYGWEDVQRCQLVLCSRGHICHSLAPLKVPRSWVAFADFGCYPKVLGWVSQCPCRMQNIFW